MKTSSRSLLATAILVAGLCGPAACQEILEGKFDWDLVSLEQNNPRFNGSVLSGFHSIRSPGTTPRGAWKTGLGVLYSQEDQTASGGGTVRNLDNHRVVLNPKVNYGAFSRLETGFGMEFVYADGSVADRPAGGGVEETRKDNFNVSGVVGGVKWNFYRDPRLRLATSFDTRIATRAGQFGMLPATLFNFELDGDYAFSSRFSVISNLQFMTSDRPVISDQVIFDVGGNYTFSDRFRGILFGTVQEDDEADSAVFFVGFAGQYLFENHSFTLGLDFQLNDARREIRTDNQIDLEFSYTFTF